MILQSKSRTVLAHLLPSLLLLAAIGGLVLFTWYPYPFLQFNDSGKLLLLMVVSATFFGPALTWFVHKENRRALLFDLIVIVLVQLLAITWAAHNLYQNRPYFMVFAVDRFDVLSIRDVDLTNIPNPNFLDKPVSGPVLLYASMPNDEQRFQELLQEVMFEGKPDLQFRPEFWSLYDEKQQQALAVSKPLLMLREARKESIQAIDQIVEIHGGDINKLKFVPVMIQKYAQFAAILDAKTGEVVDTVLIDPWVN